MDGDLENMTYTQDLFVIGWFRFPIEEGENYEVIETLYDILMVIAVLSNPLLLWMIIKNPGNNTRKNSAVLLANLCLVNLAVGSAGLLHLVARIINPDNPSEIISYKVGAIFMSIILPKYYTTIFILTLSYYGMIVKPMKFKALEPQKVRTMIGITIGVWVGMTLAFLITPFLVDDFNNYVKIMVTVVVSGCWFLTIIIVAMYARILSTLRSRAISLKHTFNMASSRQGVVMIKQNQKLAKVLFLFIASLVMCTLPIYTGYLFVLHCPQCSHRAANVKFCLYMTPVFLSVPAFHAFHWLLGTPQYYKELKQLGRRMLVFCRLVNED